MLKYRLTNIVKPTKLYLLYIIVYMYIVLFFRNVFHPHKKSFLITGIELKLCHYTSLTKTLEKSNITLCNYYCWSWNISRHNSKHEAQICKQCRKQVED